MSSSSKSIRALRAQFLLSAKPSACLWQKSPRESWSAASYENSGLTSEVVPKHISVKEAVFPFNKFPGVDTLLGPEMKSTGEVMGIDANFGVAFAKAQLGGGMRLPQRAGVYQRARRRQKNRVAPWRRDSITADFGSSRPGAPRFFRSAGHCRRGRQQSSGRQPAYR